MRPCAEQHYMFIHVFFMVYCVQTVRNFTNIALNSEQANISCFVHDQSVPTVHNVHTHGHYCLWIKAFRRSICSWRFMRVFYVLWTLAFMLSSYWCSYNFHVIICLCSDNFMFTARNIHRLVQNKYIFFIICSCIFHIFVYISFIIVHILPVPLFTFIIL